MQNFEIGDKVLVTKVTTKFALQMPKYMHSLNKTGHIFHVDEKTDSHIVRFDDGACWSYLADQLELVAKRYVGSDGVIFREEPKDPSFKCVDSDGEESAPFRLKSAVLTDPFPLNSRCEPTVIFDSLDSLPTITKEEEALRGIISKLQKALMLGVESVDSSVYNEYKNGQEYTSIQISFKKQGGKK